MRATWLLLISLVSSAACLRQTEFRCATNDQCGPNGTCETVGYCSFPDSECGRRFGDSAGTYANKCVGGTPGGDGSVIIDSAPPIIDGPAATCPANFADLPGAPAGGHKYRKVPTDGNWDTQRMACVQLSAKAYLAVPDDAAELMGLAMVSGGATPFWVGLDDKATEGTFIKVLGGVATFLPWATTPAQQPDGGTGENCVTGIALTISDERCSGGGGASVRPAVCECEP